MIDTLQLSEELQKESQLPEIQSRAIVRAIASAMRQEQLVTRDYLNARLAQLKADIIVWVVGLLFVHAAVTLGGVYFIINSILSHWKPAP